MSLHLAEQAHGHGPERTCTLLTCASRSFWSCMTRASALPTMAAWLCARTLPADTRPCMMVPSTCCACAPLRARLGLRHSLGKSRLLMTAASAAHCGSSCHRNSLRSMNAGLQTRARRPMSQGQQPNFRLPFKHLLSNSCANQGPSSTAYSLAREKQQPHA